MYEDECFVRCFSHVACVIWLLEGIYLIEGTGSSYGREFGQALVAENRVISEYIGPAKYA